MAHPYWPLFDLRIRTPRVELRLPSDDDLVALCDLARDGITEAGAPSPFFHAWHQRPSPELERAALQFHWRARAELTPEKWVLPFVIVAGGVIVGTQGVDAEEFPVVRSVGTGSWLGRRYQGQGLGKEMRAAALHFAFAGLGAQVAFSAAWVDNERSARVSRSLGYEDDGFHVKSREGEAMRLRRFRLERERWEERRRFDIEIEGLDGCLEMLGLAAVTAG